MKGKFTIRDLFLQVHLWLGLATGAVIAVVCLTGAILVFEKEIEMGLNPARYYVEPAGERLPLDEVAARVRAELPETRVGVVTVHSDPRRALEVGEGGRGGAKAYVNPYTGAVLDPSVRRSEFFRMSFELHRWLLAGDTGKLIVGVSTLLFLVIILSGVVVWWPKTRRMLRARLTVQRRAGWKRVNHDLHVSLGIYTAVALFVMAFTGLAWSFEWFNDGIYKITNSPKPSREPVKSAVVEGAERLPLETAFVAGSTALGPAEFYTLDIPREEDGAFTVRGLPVDAPHERATDAIHVDQYSGEVVKADRYAERSLGARARATFYPVHVGSIWGMPTRILFFVACVLGFTFPITGAVIWYNKRSKRWFGRKPRPVRAAPRRTKRETVGAS